jgi:hypothetical protein
MGRRGVLRGAALAVPAGALATAGLPVGPEAAWAQSAKVLQPHTMATLVRASRDIYPHDQVPDRFYVAAAANWDEKAASDAALRQLLDGGVAQLDTTAKAQHGRQYLDVAEEARRVAVLNTISGSPFFQRVRADLVVALYNQHDLWRIFGYEGSSFHFGGYLHRGFDDIDWLPKS